MTTCNFYILEELAELEEVNEKLRRQNNRLKKIKEELEEVNEKLRRQNNRLKKIKEENESLRWLLSLDKEKKS